MNQPCRRTTLAVVAAGLLLIQIGWILALPPYTGVDEFDHAYRAASVAEGHIVDWRQAQYGRGDLITVPADVVAAATEPCMSVKYTRLNNCHPASWQDSEGNVLIASASARYNPIFYWLVGTPAKVGHGDGRLFIMRSVTALICWAILLFASWVCLNCSRTIWPMAGVLTSLTPVVLYASANVAPNGVQFAAGVLSWTAAIALARSSGGRRDRRLVAAFVAGLCIVATVHTTGPLWAFLSILTLALLPAARRKARDLWSRDRARFMVAAATVAIFTLSSVLWTLNSGANIRDGDQHNFGSLRWEDLVGEWPLWVFQTVGGLPWRNEYMPPLVFACGIVSFAALAALGIRFASTGERLAIATFVLIFFAVPSFLTYATFDDLGFAWQGRYALPYACGMVILASWVLDRADSLVRLRYAPLGPTALFGVCQTVSIYVVAQRYQPEMSFLLGHAASILAILSGIAAVAIIRAIFTECRRPSAVPLKERVPQR